MAGIYIHIPFCKKACHYCDFHFSTSLKNKEALLNALQKELIAKAVVFKAEVVQTIYFGGGTPSILQQEEIDALLQVIYQNYKLVAQPEVTLEANPDDLSLHKIQDLARSKVNRLSIGIQSFFEDDLQMMNRAHTAAESKACLEHALQYFDNITIDLIYGVPNMSMEKWEQNIDTAIALGIHHISCYALTVEEKTALHSFIKNNKYPPVDEELAFAHFQLLVEKLTAADFVHYEISNFGKPNYFSAHNTSYWQGKPYLGIGPSAHSYYKNTRYWNVANNTKYIKAIEAGDSSYFESEVLSLNDRFNEAVMIGLRTMQGIDLDSIQAEYGMEHFYYLQKHAAPFLKNGTLVIENNYLSATSKGKFLTDGIAAELFYV